MSFQEESLSDHEPIDMDVEPSNLVESDPTNALEFQESSMDIDEIDSTNNMELHDTNPIVDEATTEIESHTPLINIELDGLNSVASQPTITHEPIIGPASMSQQGFNTLDLNQLIQLRDSMRTTLGLNTTLQVPLSQSPPPNTPAVTATVLSIANTSTSASTSATTSAILTSFAFGPSLSMPTLAFGNASVSAITTVSA